MEVITEDAPVVDGTGGQGGEGEGGGEPISYGGFDTPEALAEAYESKTNEIGSLTEQIQNLESLKGRHGNEIGSLRTELANLQGQVEAYKTSTPATQAGPSIDEIAKQLRDGDLSEADAIKMASEQATQNAVTKLGKQFQDELKSEIGNLRAENDHKEYVRNFTRDNPGYEEAYRNGSLNKWLNVGMSGEQAWDKYQLEATRTELKALKEQSQEAQEKAEKDGINKGVQIEKGKTPAGKVLNGKTTAFSQKGGGYDLTNPTQRRIAGVEYLNKMRAGG